MSPLFCCLFHTCSWSGSFAFPTVFKSTVFLFVSLFLFFFIYFFFDIANMIAKLNVSKRTITTLTAFSIILTLLCLFYVTNRSHQLQQPSSSAAESYAKATESNATSLQQPPSLPVKCIENTADRNQIKLTKQAWNQCLDAGATPEYYLSIVIVTRMDDYAGYVNFGTMLAQTTK